jgi:hypothetical protein
MAREISRVGPRGGWENNIKMDYHDVSCEDMDSVHLAEVEVGRDLVNFSSVKSVEVLE